MKDIGSLFKQVSDDPWLWLRVYDKSNIYLIVGSLGRFRHLKLLRKSNYGTYQLSVERKRLGISQGMKSASETRFSSSYIQAKAVQTCVPAIQACLEKETLIFSSSAVSSIASDDERSAPDKPLLCLDKEAFAIP